MIDDSLLFKKVFSEELDANRTHRERLKQALIGFRGRVSQLIQTIPADMKGYTVHDISHLDALWNMADLIAGEGYELNPAEAFVFGGAVLLHDSAMTVAAYLGGVEEVKKTPEYADAIAQIKARFSEKGLAGAEYDSQIIGLALTDALRIKHAAKAEQLSTQAWRHPVDGTDVFLLDDSDLREHYGLTIGRIAHSHHWDLNEIPKILGNKLGAHSSFPTTWTIDQVKIALLLRCVDAMHIDDRRAPRILFSAWQPSGVSKDHWMFQSKLAQPHIAEGKLIYTSKSKFTIEQATAWQTCFDTIQMIDAELRGAEDLQLQMSLPKFNANSVKGAGSPESLSRYIEVDGWRPLPLNLKVSDVSKLARTLGGKDLYAFPLAPLRELIQNAADSIEARAAVDKDFKLTDGSIVVRVIENSVESYIEVEDNGIGMSEKVMTSALLDFGYSFWKSSEARAEFPGLQASAPKFRGRYGIGFFSVFMWSDTVSVSSRRFSDGTDSSKVLEFKSGLDTRPIVRPSAVNEKSSKWVTRVKLTLKTTSIESLVPRVSEHQQYSRERLQHLKNWKHALKMLCGALSVKVELDQGSKLERVSLSDWKTCDAGDFFDFFSEVFFDSNETVVRYSKNLTDIYKDDLLVGRAFVSPGGKRYTYAPNNVNVAVFDKGIFVGFDAISNVYGIVESETINAARDRFHRIRIRGNDKWLLAVKPATFATCRNIGEELACQGVFCNFGSPDHNQIMFIKDRKFVSHNELMTAVSHDGAVVIRLLETGEGEFSLKAADDLSVITGLVVNSRRVYSLVDIAGKIDEGSDVKKLIGSSEEEIFKFLAGFCKLLGPDANVISEHVEKSGYRSDYIEVTISRSIT